MQHILSTKQFLDTKILNQLFNSTQKLQSLPLNKYPKPLKGRIIATLFYEPSTRTRLSFESAVLKLGGSLLSTENAAATSSAVKGETLEDTIRVVSSYADAIILRHKDPGSAERASLVSDVPIINAGDGSGEHPTQALLDLYTIQQYKHKIDRLKIGLAGDLLHSRTLHSLLYLLSVYNVELYLIAPSDYQLGKEYLEYLRSTKTKFQIINNLDNCLEDLDVLYINRLQMERHLGKSKQPAPSLTTSNIGLLKPEAIIMNPLPRVDEIAVDIDKDRRAIYFAQAKNGLFVRMSLLQQVLSAAPRLQKQR